MNEKIKGVLLFLILLVFYFVSSHFTKKSYYETSLERFKLCLEQTKENNLPVSVCSQISSASDLAYSSAVSNLNWIEIILWMIIVLFGFKIISINKELKEIKEKLNA